MNNNHISLVRNVIPLWYAQVAWAKELLIHAFNLESAEQILNREFRGINHIPNTSWFIRIHGIGINIFKTEAVGGIDFDFDKPDPDEWRLVFLIEKLVNDGQLPYAMYRELIEDEQLMKDSVSEALKIHGSSSI